MYAAPAYCKILPEHLNWAGNKARSSPTRLIDARQIVILRTGIADVGGTSSKEACRQLASFKDIRLIELPIRKTLRFINVTDHEQFAV